MKNCNTIYGQMLQLISRYDFEKAVNSYKTEKYSKGFKSWEQFSAMLYGQLSNHDNLRSIERGLRMQSNKLYHLGIKPIKRSTLAYANSKRSYELYQSVFTDILGRTIKFSPKHKFKFKNPLYSMDASTIDLCLSLHDWAEFRKTKAGIKMHLKLNHSGYLPEFAIVTTAKKHESKIARNFNFRKGDVVVFDRGYNDYKLFATYCNERIYFVTRLKSNALYNIVERRDVSKYKNISSDHIIEFTGFYSKKKCPLKLRKIRVKDPKTKKYIILLTNQFKWSPNTISAIYKDRWQIELFFKTMKQKLKIKSFVGTSKNAIMTQIFIALIAYLLLSYLIFLSKYNWSIYKLMSVIPNNLFIRKDLWIWLNYPFEDLYSNNIKSNQMEIMF